MTDVPKWLERWQNERAAGRSAYILRTGGSYGLGMFLVMMFANRPPVLNARTIFVYALIWIGAAGALFGATMWWLYERRYQKYLKSAGGDAA